MIHINALYDLMNHTYADFIVQGKKKLHERKALNTMVDRYADETPGIFIADRGYESFNTFAHMIENDAKFIVRIKDIGSNGILATKVGPSYFVVIFCLLMVQSECSLIPPECQLGI